MSNCEFRIADLASRHTAALSLGMEPRAWSMGKYGWQIAAGSQQREGRGRRSDDRGQQVKWL